MASSPPFSESAGIWEVKKVTQSLSSTTDMIQVTAATEDDTEDDASEKSSKPFQALIDKDLCFFSTDYRAALRGGFLEARNKSVVLDLKTTDCRHLIEWLYSGRLPDVLRTTQLFSLYVFADKTDILALRRAIMTRVVEVDETMPAFFEAAVALDSLSSTSPLYRWLLDTYVHHWMSKYPTEEDMLPNVFLLDWVKEAADRTCTTKSVYCSKCPCCEQNSCNYHEHESIKEWASTCGASNEFHAKLPNDSCLVTKTNSKINEA